MSNRTTKIRIYLALLIISFSFLWAQGGWAEISPESSIQQPGLLENKTPAELRRLTSEEIKAYGGRCVECHSKVNPGIVDAYVKSKHAPAKVGCNDCHGSDHRNLQTPTAKTCGNCHPNQLEQFGASKHAIGWDPKMTENARFQKLNDFPEMQRQGCERCHNVGKKWPDGSVGKCDSCHTRHTFSVQEAKAPTACGTCHMGPDHAQLEYYETSKHGVIYNLEGKGYEDGGRAPTCVTCHQPGGTHNVSTNVTIGTVSNGGVIQGHYKPPIKMREIPKEEYEEKRAKMLEICAKCHSTNFARQVLKDADVIKEQSDKVVGEAVNIIEGLWNKKLIDPMPGKLLLGGGQLYTGTSEVEALFFKLYKFDQIHTFKGAYHQNPDYTHWYGWSEMQRSLSAIKSEANKLEKLGGDSTRKASSIKESLGVGALLLVVGGMIVYRTIRRKD